MERTGVAGEHNLEGDEIHQLKVGPPLDEGVKIFSLCISYLTEEYCSGRCVWMKIVECRTKHADTAQDTAQFDIPGPLVTTFATHRQHPYLPRDNDTSDNSLWC